MTGAWRLAAAAALVVTVEHESGDSISMIGTPSHTGGGIYTVMLTDVTTTGTERFRVTANDVILAPFPMLNVAGGGTDMDGDGFDVPDDCDDMNAAVNPGAMEICMDGIDNDCDGSIDGADSDCAGGPACGLKSEACSVNADCCSGKCRKGKCVGGPATASLLFEPRLTGMALFAANNVSPLGCSVPETNLD